MESTWVGCWEVDMPSGLGVRGGRESGVALRGDAGVGEGGGAVEEVWRVNSS